MNLFTDLKLIYEFRKNHRLCEWNLKADTGYSVESGSFLAIGNAELASKEPMKHLDEMMETAKKDLKEMIHFNDGTIEIKLSKISYFYLINRFLF